MLRGVCIALLLCSGASRAAAQSQTTQPAHRPPPTPDPVAAPAAADSPSDPPAPSLRPELDPGRILARESAELGRVPTAAPQPAPEPMVIREPSQGRPIFIAPDGEFYFVMRLTPKLAGSDVTFNLVHALEPSLTVPLWATTPPSFFGNESASLVLKVPNNTAPGLYDLEVRARSAAFIARRCVKVIERFRTRFRFVHLSSMNVGDLTAPDFDPVLPREINLLAPEFIVATGDFTEWARAQNDPASWRRVLDYLARFDAPVFAVCGLHDHEPSFRDLVASKPVDTLDYGNYLGLLLLDHAAHPIDQDFDQIRWIDGELQKNRNRTFNFLVANSDEARILDAWRQRGALPDFLHRHRVALLITGGATDWDFDEFRDRFSGLTDFHYVRTHQSSTCLRDRASGISHYRVFEVDGDQVRYVYPDDTATERLQHSIPAGRLNVSYDHPNDGSSPLVLATAHNGLNQPFDDARLWLRVAKDGSTGSPSVAGGRLIRALDGGPYWACEVALDLPDKGAVRVVAAARPADVVPALPLDVSFDGPRELAFSMRRTDLGMRYYLCEAPASIVLRNSSDKPVRCWPVVRLNGSPLRLDPGQSARLPVEVVPGSSVKLPLLLTLRRVSDGPHLVQVHFLDDPLARLSTFPVELKGPSEPARAALDSD